MRFGLLALLLLISSCNTQLMSRAGQESDLQQVALLEELRIALADVKQAQRAQALDLTLLEEKLVKLGTPGKIWRRALLL